jgi:hypothetical protein
LPRRPLHVVFTIVGLLYDDVVAVVVVVVVDVAVVVVVTFDVDVVVKLELSQMISSML